MADDSVTLNDANDAPFKVAVDTVGQRDFQVVKIAVGAEDTATYVSAAQGPADSGTVRVVASSDDPGVAAAQTANTLLTNIDGSIDGVEALLTTGNTTTAGLATVRATAAAPTYTEGQTPAPISVTTAGDMRVVAKQSGSWTVALPTDASTATNQAAVIGTKAPGTAAVSSILTGGVYNTSLPTLTNGQQASAQMDASGRVFTAATQSGTWNITNVSGVISLPTGASSAANQTTQIAAMGAPADAAWTSGNGTHTALLKAIAASATSLAPTITVTESPSWVYIAASQTDAAGGNANDLLDSILVIPASFNPGAVSIEDGAGTNYTIFAGGTGSVSTMIPFPIDMRNIAAGTGWEITTGASVSVIAFYRART